jgi:hypothetical protein
MEGVSTGNWLPLLRASNKEVYRVKAGASAGHRQSRTLLKSSACVSDVVGSAVGELPAVPAARRPQPKVIDEYPSPGIHYEPGTRLMYGSIVALQSSFIADSWLTLCADIGARAGIPSSMAGQSILDGAPSWCEVTSSGPWATASSEVGDKSANVAAPSAAEAPAEIEVAGVTRKRRVTRILQSCAFRLVNADSPLDRSTIMAKDTVAFEVILNGRPTGWCLGSRVSYHKPSDPRYCMILP